MAVRMALARDTHHAVQRHQCTQNRGTRTCLVNPQFSITADETSQVQVVVQEIPEIPVVEWKQEQSTVTDLMNPQISTTSVAASQVVGSFPFLEDFATRMYNQVHQEQIVATVQQQAIVQEIPEVQVVERIQEQFVETIEALPQEQVQQHTAIQIVHVPVPQIQEQSAITGLVNSQFPITAVEASQVVGWFFLSLSL